MQLIRIKKKIIAGDGVSHTQYKYTAKRHSLWRRWGGMCVTLFFHRNSFAWWGISQCQTGFRPASHDEQSRWFSPSFTWLNKHLFPPCCSASVTGEYWIPDKTVTMSMEGNYILNVLFFPSFSSGRGKSICCTQRLYGEIMFPRALKRNHLHWHQNR